MEARDRSIEAWFNRIRSGQLRLPRFQRYEAWDDDDVGDVIDAVLNDLPIGATLVLEIGAKEPFVTRPLMGAPRPTERCTEHLLDGQQRLTALWKSLHDLYPEQAFFVQIKQPKPDSDGTIPARIVRVKRWLDKSGKRFPAWADDPKHVFQRGLAPVRFLQPSDISGERQTWCDSAVERDLQASRDLENTLRDLQEKVKHFNLPMLCLPVSTSPATALDVFVKMNTSAVPLSAFDIIVAQFEARTGKSMHDLITDLREKCRALEHYIGPEQMVLQAAALRADRTPTQASFHQLDLSHVDSSWPEIVSGIRWAIQMLEEEHIFDGQRLPTVTVLPVLAALHSHLPSKLDAHGNAMALVRAYLWRSFVTDRYESTSTTRSLQDYRALRDVLLGKGDRSAIPAFNSSQHPLPTDLELVQAGWPRRKETLARAILAASLKRGGFDIADGNPISRERLASREYHHLFPYAVLTGDGKLSDSAANRALNCVLITMSTNRNISAKEPVRYLAERIDKADLGANVVRSRLETHVVPFDELNVGGYASITSEEDREARIRQDFAAFLQARASMVSSAFRALCEGHNWPNEGK